MLAHILRLFAHRQWDFIGYGPIAPSFFSVCGSSLIIAHVLYKGRAEKLKKPHLRLLLVMSLYDLACSLVFPWSHYMHPAGYGWDRAEGNMSSCRAQGYFITLSTAIGGYNSLLCLYYYLTICRGLSLDTWRKIERVAHVFIFVMFNLLGALGVAYKLFNPSLSGCFIASYPPACEMFPFAPTCERVKPENLRMLNYIFNRAWLIIYVVTVTTCNFLIWRKVKNQHAQVNKVDTGVSATRDSSTSVDPRTKRERMVFRQCLLFTIAFLIAQLGPLMFLVSEEAGYLEFWQAALTIVLWPMQGFLNAIIFGRPLFVQVRARFPHLTTGQAFYQVFFTKDPLVLDESLPRASRVTISNKLKQVDTMDTQDSQKTSRVSSTNRGGISTSAPFSSIVNESATEKGDEGHEDLDENNRRMVEHSETVEENEEDPSGDPMEEVHESFDQEHEDEIFEEAEA